jgi:site-specific DNA recombinase
MVTALKASHSDTKRYHNEMITTLQKQYHKLQHRLDAMYVDKLDGTISPAFFDQKSSEWRSEQADILRKIEQHQRANQTYVDEGVRLLELAQRAIYLYERQEMREKRRLLDFVFSNSTWKDGCLIPTYRKPFDMMAVTNEAYRKEKAVGGTSDGFSEIWLPGPDSNQRPIG